MTKRIIIFLTILVAGGLKGLDFVSIMLVLAKTLKKEELPSSGTSVKTY